MKRHFLIFIVLFLSATLFAKSKSPEPIPPSANVTDADVIAFANHFGEIMEQMKAYSDGHGDNDNDYDEDEFDEKDFDEQDFNSSFDQMDDEQKAMFENLLEEKGITGPNRCEKMGMILLCFSKMKMEQELKEAPKLFQHFIIKKIKKIFDENINPDDEAVVYRHRELLEDKIGSILDEENNL